MKIKTTLVALTLALTPMAALAMEDGCGWSHKAKETTASACAEGQTFNETLGICVTASTS